MSSGFYLPSEMENALEYNAGIGDNNGDTADQQPNSSSKQTKMSFPQALHNTNELNTHSRLESNSTDDSSQDINNLSQDMKVIKYAPNMGPAEAQGYSARQRRNSFQNMTGFGHANKVKLSGSDMNARPRPGTEEFKQLIQYLNGVKSATQLTPEQMAWFRPPTSLDGSLDSPCAMESFASVAVTRQPKSKIPLMTNDSPSEHPAAMFETPSLLPSAMVDSYFEHAARDSLSAPQSPNRQPILQHKLMKSPPKHTSPYLLVKPPAKKISHKKVEIDPVQALLHDYIKSLPLDAPSPFKVAIFDENPSQKRALVVKSVPIHEIDEKGHDHKWTEEGLVLEEPKRYRARCLITREHKIELQQGSTIEGVCMVWTRKYPQGWQGLCQTNDDKIVEIKSADSNMKELENPVWVYAAAATVAIDGKEIKVQCVVSGKIVEVKGISYDLEPSWEDVANALRQEAATLERKLGWPQDATFPAPSMDSNLPSQLEDYVDEELAVEQQLISQMLANTQPRVNPHNPPQNQEHYAEATLDILNQLEDYHQGEPATEQRPNSQRAENRNPSSDMRNISPLFYNKGLSALASSSNPPENRDDRLVTPTAEVSNAQPDHLKLPSTEQWEVPTLPSQHGSALGEGGPKADIENYQPGADHSSASHSTVVVEEAICKTAKDNTVVEPKKPVVGNRGRAKRGDTASEKGNPSSIKPKIPRKRKQGNAEEVSAKPAKTPRKRKEENGEGSSTATPAKTPRKRKQENGEESSNAAPAKTPQKRKQRADDPSAPSERPRPAVTEAETPVSPPNDNTSFADESQSARSVSNVGITPASQSSSFANIEFPSVPQEAMSDIGNIVQDYRRRREQQGPPRQPFIPQQFPGAHEGPSQGFQSSRPRSNSRRNQPPITATEYADDHTVPQQIQLGQPQFQGPPVDFEYAQQIQQMQQARQAQLMQLQASQFSYGYNASGYPHQFQQFERNQGNLAAVMHNDNLARVAQGQYQAQVAAMNGFDMSGLWKGQHNYEYDQLMGADANFAVGYATFAGYQPNVQHNPRQLRRSQSIVNQPGYPPSQPAHHPSGVNQSDLPDIPNQQLGGSSTMQCQQMQRPPTVVPPSFGDTPIQGVRAQSASQRRDLLNFIERNDPEYIQQMYLNWHTGQEQGLPAAPSQRDDSIDPSLYESSN